MPREWLNLVLPDRPDVNSLTLAVCFLAIVPAGCFLTVLACCVKLGAL